MTTAHRLLVGAIETGTHRWDASEEGLIEALYSLLLVCWYGGRAELWEPFYAALERLEPGAARPAGSSTARPLPIPPVPQRAPLTCSTPSRRVYPTRPIPRSSCASRARRCTWIVWPSRARDPGASFATAAGADRRRLGAGSARSCTCAWRTTSPDGGRRSSNSPTRAWRCARRLGTASSSGTSSTTRRVSRRRAGRVRCRAASSPIA